jgi:hypothetical protein
MPGEENSTMPVRYAFAAPVLPGKTEQLRAFAGELMGSRKSGYDDLNRRAGVSAEYMHLMPTPEGDMVIVYGVSAGDEPPKAGAEFIDTGVAFDRWFRQQVLEITGIDVLEVGGDPSDALVAWQAP